MRISPRAAAAMISVACISLIAPAASSQPPATPAPPAVAKPPPVYVPTSLKVDPGLPRTPDGHPDFQGEVWATNFFGLLTGIPGVTPPDLVITAEQSKKSFATFAAGAKISPMLALDPEVPGLLEASDGFPVVRGQYRTRLLVQPADGKMPFTPAAEKEIQAVLAALNSDKSDNPEDRSDSERCLDMGASAPITFPSPLSPRQFVQTPKYLAINTEYGDEVQVIPFADHHGPAAVAPRTGDAIAHWEGDTLVIETTQVPASGRMRATPFGAVIVNADAKVIERFTRVSRDELIYQFTILDPKVYAQPWLGEYSLRRATYRMFPSGCHEGNYGLPNILSGAREGEAAILNWAKAEKINLATSEPAVTWTPWFGAGPNGGVRAWAVLPSVDGKPRVGLRVEPAKANKVAGADVLSELDVFAIDCAGQKLQMVSQTGFDARNFAGARHDGTPATTWLATSTRPAIADGIAQVCSPPAQVAQR
jgi:hypothetical protein